MDSPWKAAMVIIILTALMLPASTSASNSRDTDLQENIFSYDEAPTRENNTEPSYDPLNRTIDLLEDFGTFVYDLNNTFFDPDEDDIITYGIWNGTGYSNYTKTKVIAEIVNWSLVLTSIADVTGILQLNIQAEDLSGLTNWTLIQITIENVNDPPRVINDLPDPHKFAEGQSSYIDISYYVDDPDHFLLQLNGVVTSAPNLVASLDLSTSPYLILYAKEDDWFGETFALIDIKDPMEASLEINLSVIVTPVNDLPVDEAPSVLTIDEDKNISLDLTEWFQDPEGNTLDFTLNISNPEDILIELNGTILNITPRENYHGNSGLTINVSDGESFIIKQVTIKVLPINDAPVLEIPDTIEILEDQEIYIELSELNPHDPDDDPIFFSISSISDQLWSVSLPSNDTIHIQPSVDRFGPANFTLTMEDGRGGVTRSLIDVNIESVNDPPMFIVPPNWTTDILPGGNREMDMSSDPYLVEDVDHLLEDLVLISDYELASFDGLILNVSLPQDISSTELNITVWIQDPDGALSAGRELRIKVMEIEDSLISLTNLSATSENGVLKVRAEGSPYQTLWAVISSEDGLIGSYWMKETTSGSGSYELNIEDLDREDGEALQVHISLTKDGPNDSNLPGADLTFREKIENGDNGEERSLLPLLAVISILLLALIIAVVIWNRKRDRVSDFDYNSLLEE